MENKPTTRLFVGSLPYRFTEGELLDLFVQFGRIVSLKIIKNRWGRSRGMGYVEFDNLESAVKAKQAMHHYRVEDLSIIVDYAQPDPFLTPEGRQRHEEAMEKHPRRFQPKQPRAASGSPAFKSGNFFGEDFKPRSPRRSGQDKSSSESATYQSRSRKPASSAGRQRQTVFDSRRYGSRVGAKFAAKTKKKSR